MMFRIADDQRLFVSCCEGRKHKRYRMETPTGWPVHNLARMRSALWRLEELEKRLGQTLLGRQCKDCGANPCSDLFTKVNGPIHPMLCQRCELERVLPKHLSTRH